MSMGGHGLRCRACKWEGEASDLLSAPPSPARMSVWLRFLRWFVAELEFCPKCGGGSFEMTL